MEFILLSQVMFTKEDLKKIRKVGMESKILEMEINIKAFTIKVFFMVKVK